MSGAAVGWGLAALPDRIRTSIATIRLKSRRAWCARRGNTNSQQPTFELIDALLRLPFVNAAFGSCDASDVNSIFIMT